MNRHLVCALLLLAAALPAWSRALSADEERVLREGRQSAPQEKWQPAIRLAERLGHDNNTDALPLLVELRDVPLLNAFAREFTGDTTPFIEEAAIRFSRDRDFGPQVLGLVRNYRSRALFDTLLADIQGGIAAARSGKPGLFPNHLHAINAIVRTDMAGIEDALAALLPQLHPQHGRPIVQLLAKRRYVPSQDALFDVLRRTAPGQELGDTAYTLSRLDTQRSLDALAARLVELRTLPPSSPPEAPAPGGWTAEQLARIRLREQNEGMVTLVRTIEEASPANKLPRALFTPQVVAEFSPEQGVRVARMLKWRDEQENAASTVTPDNFTRWARLPQRIAQLSDFIARGAPVNAADAVGDTPLLAAVKGRNLEGIGLLLRAGARPDARDRDRLTPLLVAARQDGPPGDFAASMAKALIAGKADLSAADSSGRTPLHMAVGLKFGKMVRLLVDSGADVNAEASESGLHGLTPLQLALDVEDRDTAALLRAHGARTNPLFAVKRGAARAAGALIGPLYGSH